MPRPELKTYHPDMSANSIEKIEVYPDSAALTRAAAIDFVTLAREAVTARGVFSVALSGGTTPKRLFTLLADEVEGELAAPWECIHCFFGDERHVPPEHPDSNFRMANEALLSRVPIPMENIHRIRAEDPDAARAASEYETDLRAFFESRNLTRDGFPRFDLILLGMGPDGHTASLFPDSDGLHETQKWVIANWVAKFQTDRITFTFPAINHAAKIALFVAGKDKSSMLEEVLVAYKDAPKYPVQFVRPIDGEKLWLLDSAAAAELGALPQNPA